MDKKVLKTVLVIICIIGVGLYTNTLHKEINTLKQQYEEEKNARTELEKEKEDIKLEWTKIYQEKARTEQRLKDIEEEKAKIVRLIEAREAYIGTTAAPQYSDMSYYDGLSLRAAAGFMTPLGEY